VPPSRSCRTKTWVAAGPDLVAAWGGVSPIDGGLADVGFGGALTDATYLVVRGSVLTRTDRAGELSGGAGSLDRGGLVAWALRGRPPTRTWPRRRQARRRWCPRHRLRQEPTDAGLGAFSGDNLSSDAGGLDGGGVLSADLGSNGSAGAATSAGHARA
jgi:hypothetical protein